MTLKNQLWIEVWSNVLSDVSLPMIDVVIGTSTNFSHAVNSIISFFMNFLQDLIYKVHDFYSFWCWKRQMSFLKSCTLYVFYFQDVEDFVRHKRTHPEEDPFRCVYCNSSHPNKYSLQRHLPCSAIQGSDVRQIIKLPLVLLSH